MIPDPTPAPNLEAVRSGIDALDARIIELIAERQLGIHAD